jgi:GTPase
MNTSPVLALVGRPNVGKSTLFNRLTARRDALVADVPGLTRDRRYGRALVAGESFTLIDTGGLLGDAGDITSALEQQAFMALEEADGVLFLVDARQGLTPADQDIADRIRRLNKPTLLVVNKTDGVDESRVVSEFAGLGFPDVVHISAAHGRGIADLADWVAAQQLVAQSRDLAEDYPDAIRVALIGRPNVGKSTLTNRLLGEERQLVYDAPGTTRDAIAIPFSKDDRDYLLIDTAGVRRKGRVEGTVEKFSVVKSLQAMAEAHVVILVMDARESVVDQDLHLLSYAAQSGAGVLVALNKWDGLDPDQKQQAKSVLDRKLRFAPWIPVLQISALHGTGVGHLLAEVDQIYQAGEFDVGATRLTNLLEAMLIAHPPPSVRGRQIKLRFAHKAGSHPPKIAIHGNLTKEVPASYLRFLENSFRDALGLVGNPVQIEMRSGDNPYAGRKNVLTRRQQQRRQRVIKHRRK